MLENIKIDKLTLDDYKYIINSVPKDKHYYLSLILRDKLVTSEYITDDYYFNITYIIKFNKSFFLQLFNKQGFIVKGNKIKFIGNKYSILNMVQPDLRKYDVSDIILTKFNVPNELKKFLKHKNKNILLDNFIKNFNKFNKSGLGIINNVLAGNSHMFLIFSKLPKKKIIEISELNNTTNIAKAIYDITNPIIKGIEDYNNRSANFNNYLLRTKSMNIKDIVDIINNNNIELIISNPSLYIEMFHDETLIEETGTF